MFYWLCYVKKMSTDMLEEQVSQEGESDVNQDGDIRMEDSWEEYWKYVADDGEDKKKIHALRWDVYTRYMKGFINIQFSLSIPHPKGGEIVQNCVKDNIIDEKDKSEAIRLYGFDYKSSHR